MKLNYWLLAFPSLGLSVDLLAQSSPRSLHPNVVVDTYQNLSQSAIQLERDPVSQTLFYAVDNGNVVQLRPDANGQLTEVTIASVADHGIATLYGMAFSDSTLILSGYRRLPFEGIGRVMKGRLRPDGTRQWTVLLETAPYPYSNTAFDHSFNGLCVTPDGDSVYVNSGSRTDHGEVQDTGGRFPGLRETALTARIFKLPLSGQNLTLPNDEQAVQQSGLLFCVGTRNTFSMAFNSEGRLFGPDNAGNRSDPEELNWLRPGRHYGFPWLIGGNETPQQFPNYDPNNDPLLSPGYRTDGFRNDPTYPPRPNVAFTPAMLNTGPEANFVVNPNTRQWVQSNTITTFTGHASPLGLVFDTDSLLADFTGQGFVLGFTNGRGLDLSALRLQYDRTTDNYRTSVNRIAEGFNQPVDAVLDGSTLYVLELGRRAISRAQFRQRTNRMTDLRLSMRVDERVRNVGQPVSVSLTVTNRGPTRAQNIQVRSRLPEGITFQNSTTFQPTSDGLVATIGELSAEQERTVQFRATVSQAGTYRVAAEIIRSSLPDPTSTPNTGTGDGEDDMAVADLRTMADGPLRISPNPNGRVLPPVQSNQPPPTPNRSDLGLQIVGNSLVPRVGDVLSVTFTIRNDGGQPANGVSIKVLLPATFSLEADPIWSVSGNVATSSGFGITAGSGQTRTLRLRVNSAGPFTLKSTLTGPADADSTPDNGYDTGEDDEARLDGRAWQ